MRNKIKLIKTLILCFILMLGISSTSFAATKTFSPKIVDSQKTFNIKFNYNINSSSIKDKIIVKNNNGNIINTIVSVENNIIKVKAPKDGYNCGEYILSILDNIKSTCNKSNKYKYSMNFNVITNKEIRDLKVHFINVGQADSILITEKDHSMLIDAGNNADGTIVVDYLKKMGIKKLDYVVGTHPHEDHIGGLDNVIKAFNIGKIYMPSKINNTKTYKDVITAIKNKGMKITLPKPGDTFKLGEASCTIVAPKANKDYESVNDYSIVIKLTYGKTSFLFTGDAEALSESEILQSGYDIKADVLKVAHHGSRTSSTDAFLDKVSPKYAVISCEKGNDYGHPHKATMDRLKSRKIPVYRTDEAGTIVATSNGKEIGFNVKSGSYNYSDNKPIIEPKPTQGIESTVYITKSGKKFHRGSCEDLRKSKFSINREEAIKKGFTPCTKCNP